MQYWQLLIYSLCFLSTLTCIQSSEVLELDDSSADQIFEGQWVVLFYGPWCPACTIMKSRWEELAQSEREYKVATIDVHTYPALSGQFLIFNLPTIFFIDQGECKQYIGIHDVSAIKSWISDGTAKAVDPIPAWRSPDSYMLRALGRFFDFANQIRTLKNSLVVEYGIPSWMAYAIFVCATILIGGLVGLTVVCFCDFFFPPKPSIIIEDSLPTRPKESRSSGDSKTSGTKNQETADSDNDQSEADSESSHSETAVAAESDGSSNKEQVRKRRKSKK